MDELARLMARNSFISWIEDNKTLQVEDKIAILENMADAMLMRNDKLYFMELKDKVRQLRNNE